MEPVISKQDDLNKKDLSEKYYESTNETPDSSSSSYLNQNPI